MRKKLLLTFLVLSSCQTIIGQSGGGKRDFVAPTPPANYPPAGYPLTEFRDKRGCDYILAGDGSTQSWVPLVTIGGSAICGGQSVEYNVGAGVEDVHGTLTAPKPTPQPQPKPTQTAGQSSGGIMGMISGMFGGGKSEPKPTVVSGQDIVIYEDQISKVPGTPVETVEVDVVTVVPAPTQQPTPVPTVAPPPQVAPAPVAPTQQIIAPAPVNNPNLAVQVGNMNAAEAYSVVRKLEAEGYRVKTVNLGTSVVVQVRPKAGQTTQQLQAEMRAKGFREAILVGVTR